MSPLLLSHRLMIGSQAYLPAEAVGRQLAAVSRWDPEARLWTLRSGRHFLKASPQIPVVLIDDEAILLRRPPLFQEGQILIPESVWKRWLSRWEGPPAGAPEAAAPWLKTIVVDAGHGGHDPGAIGRGGLREKAVTLDVARRLRDLLIADGFQVVMTREGDRFVSLGQRAALANRAGGDLFVSVHANSSRHRSAGGFEVYYLSAATDDHARALEAAENVALPGEVKDPVDSDTRGIVWDLLYTEHRAESTDLAARICQGLKRELSTANRGVKSARFAVLKGARMPAILVEIGFISNPQEEARMRKGHHRQAAAEGIHQGILSFRESLKEKNAASP